MLNLNTKALVAMGLPFHPKTGKGRDDEGKYSGPVVVKNPGLAGWSGTILDLLRMAHIPAEYRIWVATREGVVDKRILRLFAMSCARRMLIRIKPDQDAIAALATGENFANGAAAAQELAAASEKVRSLVFAANEAAENAKKAAAKQKDPAALKAADDAALRARAYCTLHAALRWAEEAHEAAAWAAWCEANPNEQLAELAASIRSSLMPE